MRERHTTALLMAVQLAIADAMMNKKITSEAADDIIDDMEGVFMGLLKGKSICGFRLGGPQEGDNAAATEWSMAVNNDVIAVIDEVEPGALPEHKGYAE